jgi:hypothetical protein
MFPISLSYAIRDRCADVSQLSDHCADVKEPPTTPYDPSPEEVSKLLDELLEEGKDPIFKLKARRVAIGGWFLENVHGGEPDSSSKPWKGPGGVMPRIKESCGIQRNVDISQILEDVVECKRLGIEFTGE